MNKDLSFKIKQWCFTIFIFLATAGILSWWQRGILFEGVNVPEIKLAAFETQKVGAQNFPKKTNPNFNSRNNIAQTSKSILKLHNVIKNAKKLLVNSTVSFSSTGTITQFSDSNGNNIGSNTTLDFKSVGTQTAYFKMPRGARATSSSVNVFGLKKYEKLPVGSGGGFSDIVGSNVYSNLNLVGITRSGYLYGSQYSASGWSSWQYLNDTGWGGIIEMSTYIDQGNPDPDVAGNEIYVGTQIGQIWQFYLGSGRIVYDLVNPISDISAGDATGDSVDEILVALKTTNTSGSNLKSIYKSSLNTWIPESLSSGIPAIPTDIAVGNGDNYGNNDVWVTGDNGHLYMFAKHWYGWNLDADLTISSSSLTSVFITTSDPSFSGNVITVSDSVGHIYKVRYESNIWKTYSLASLVNKVNDLIMYGNPILQPTGSYLIGFATADNGVYDLYNNGFGLVASGTSYTRFSKTMMLPVIENGTVYDFQGPTYTTNPRLYISDIYLWNYTGKYYQDQIVNDSNSFSQEINKFADWWETNRTGDIIVPLNFISDSAGKLYLYHLLVHYETPTITVTSPIGGEIWEQRSTHTITWTSDGSIGTNVKIELYNSSGYYQTIISSTSNDGSYNWSVPDNITGTDLKVKISSIDKPLIYGISPNSFIIPSITVISPDGGENWQRGTTKNVTWSNVYTAGAYITIELWKNGSFNSYIASGITNSGTYQWNIPSDQTLGTDYKVKIRWSSPSTIYDFSDNNFTISAAIDTTPPDPNPMTWKTKPHATGPNSISMEANTATDSQSPPVQYYFDFTVSYSGGSGGQDSNWQSGTVYVNSGLQPNHVYCYTVKARDSATIPNETGPSSPEECATTPSEIDTTPPLPDPMTWKTAPFAVDPHMITMEATTAADTESPPVQYFFTFTGSPDGGAGGNSSTWQNTTTFLDDGLQAEKTYCYTVKARDSAAPPNETNPSNPGECVKTPPEGAIAIWHLDENSGATTYDSSGNGNDGTLYGNPTWTADSISGYALDFDGVNDYINVPNSPSLNPTSQITLGAWFKARAVDGERIIINKQASGTGYTLKILDGKGCITLEPTSSGPSNEVCTTTTIQTNQWYHLVGSYDGNTVKIFLNDNLDNSNTAQFTIEPSSIDLKIGAPWHLNCCFFDGILDEIYINTLTFSDTTPPDPNPMTWETPPYVIDEYTISMEATTATDIDSPPVQYQFNDKPWQDTPVYTDTGLNPDTEYCYTVIAKDALNNQTLPSNPETCAHTSKLPDTTPPTPNPMTWHNGPYGSDSFSVAMEANTAIDESGPVKYYFHFTHSPDGGTGGNDLDWQESILYIDEGLQPNKTYCYQVKAKDAVGNETEYSTPEECATTVDLTAPSPNPMTWETPPYVIDEYTISMEATTATDLVSPPVQYQVNDKPWQDSPLLIDNNLSPNTEYCYRVKARDSAPTPNETRVSELKCATTAEEPVVNISPEIDPITDQSVNEGQVLEFTVTAHDDNAGDIVTLSISNLPSFCQITENIVNNPASIKIKCQPDYRSAGTNKADLSRLYSNISITATDNASPPLSDNHTFNLQVNNVSIFSDVSPYFWAYGEIEALYNSNIINGYSDGYHPNEQVTRAQMAVYIARAVANGDSNVPAGPSTPSFSDVPATYWAYKYIEFCKARNIVQGYSDGYHPETVVTRDQMAVFIARAFVCGDANVPAGPDTPTFTDVAKDFWAYKYIEFLVSNNIIKGFSDNTYMPGLPVTRDQMGVFIYRAFLENHPACSY